MAPIKPVQLFVSPELPTSNSAEEIQEHFSESALVGDPRWSESDFRSQHIKLNLALEALRRFMKGDPGMTEEKLKKALGAWTQNPGFSDSENKEFNQKTLKNIHGQLDKVRSPELVNLAHQVKEFLPPPPFEPKPKPIPEPKKPIETPENTQSKKNKDKNLNVGLEFQNDTFLSDVVLGNIGIPVKNFMAEKSMFTLKVPTEFSLGPLVTMVRPYGGMFKAKGIPGDGAGEIGSGYRAGLDFGFVNPRSQRHQSVGLGLEITGIASHAGEESGVKPPGPNVRLHFFRQNDWSFALGKQKKFELGFHSLLNYQETYFTVGNDQKLLPEGQNTPFSTSSSLFTKNPFHLMGFSARYYIHGAPPKEKVDDLSRPFETSEGVTKVGRVWVGSLINRNRRRDVPAYANTRVFLGTFEPLGSEASAQQYDTLGLGLTVFSALDGYMMASNARDRGQIWRRGNWVHKGLMLGGDGANLIADITLAARAKDDPPSGQTTEEFIDDPGSVTDFKGRAGKLNLYLSLFEQGLSGLDASGAMGNIQRNRLHYILASAASLAVGLPFYFVSAPISGSECGPKGGLMRCAFGSHGEFFSGEQLNTSPKDLRQVERQYLVSSIGAALISYGVSRLWDLRRFLKGKASVSSRKGSSKTALIQDPAFDLKVGDGFRVGFSAKI